MSTVIALPQHTAPDTEGRSTVNHVHVQARAVSLDTAAAMFEWSPGRFDKWRRKWGVQYAPGSNRFLISDIDAAIDKWRKSEAPSQEGADEGDGESPMDRAMREYAEHRASLPKRGKARVPVLSKER